MMFTSAFYTQGTHLGLKFISLTKFFLSYVKSEDISFSSCEGIEAQ